MSIILGDFNEVRSENERLGSLFCKAGAKHFNEFISNYELVDLPIGGKRFTRINKYGTKLSKIDRIFVSQHFISKWPNAELNNALSRDLSNHYPLLLKTHSTDYGPIPFKFFNSWLLNEELPKIVTETWSNPNAVGCATVTHPSTLLKCKLKNLKNSIRVWIQIVRFHESNMIQGLKEDVNIIDIKAEVNGLDENDISNRLSLLRKIEDLEHIKRLDLMQKAKVRWAIEGDENSKFFHGIVNNKLSISRIKGISINGMWVT
ncbi:cytochrome P450 [Tanacetum coccineum]